MQVQHQIADGRADPRRAPVQRKHPQRQVLHGKSGCSSAPGTQDEARRLWV
jgi:hypothetical protein